MNYWKAGTYGDVSLSDGVVEYANTHEEIKGAFLTFQKDADQIYPGWKEKLGYTGKSSVQAATFDWQKKQLQLHSQVPASQQRVRLHVELWTNPVDMLIWCSWYSGVIDAVSTL